jgi:hypothetical protein
VATAVPVLPQVHRDTDGVPPSLDLQLTGKVGKIIFAGKFYAMPQAGEMVFSRKVLIIWASKEIYVAQDIENKNLYVVDREKFLSLGCRMRAYFSERIKG